MEPLQRIKAQADAQAQFKLEESRHEQELTALNDVKVSNLQAIRGLIQFLDGKVTRTEVVNQLTSISTPDVQKVVTAVDKLAQKIPPQLDLSGLENGIKALEEQLKLIPKEHPDAPEPVEEVTVTNLGDIDFTTLQKTIVDEVNKLVKSQKAPVVDVKPADVSVNVDTTEFTKGLKDLLSAVGALKFEAPATDLTKVEKKLDKSNELLKEIVDKPMGGGGGGGHGTPYVDATGKASYVELTVDGKIPVEAGATSTYESRNDTTTDTNLVYLGKALPGSATSDAAWQIKRYNKSAGHMSFADDVTTFTKVWDNRTSYSY